MYLDTVGAVTVGVGRMLPDAGAAAKLAFVRNADQAAATAQEIKDEFAVVHGQEKGVERAELVGADDHLGVAGQDVG